MYPKGKWPKGSCVPLTDCYLFSALERASLLLICKQPGLKVLSMWVCVRRCVRKVPVVVAWWWFWSVTGSFSVLTNAYTTSAMLTTMSLSVLFAQLAMPSTWHLGALCSSTNFSRACGAPSRAEKSCGSASLVAWPRGQYDNLGC